MQAVKFALWIVSGMMLGVLSRWVAEVTESAGWGLVAFLAGFLLQVYVLCGLVYAKSGENAPDDDYPSSRR